MHSMSFLRIVIFLCVASWIPTRSSAQELDSIKASNSNGGFILFVNDFLFSGLDYYSREKKQHLYIPIIYEFLPINTVEGFVTRMNATFVQEDDKGRFFQMSPILRYGFGNERIQGELATLFQYAKERKGILGVSGGRNVWQINHDSNLSAFNNGFATYALRDNFLKIYERQFLEIYHSISPINDFFISTTASIEKRTPLNNLQRYEEDDFTSNDPLNREWVSTAFEEHRAFLWNLELKWQKKHRYERKKTQVQSRSSYPAISLIYEGASKGVFGSDISFQRIAMKCYHKFFTKDWGSTEYLIEGGDFIHTDDLRFIDFKHFNGKLTMYGRFDVGDFQLLDYYLYSTTQRYIQGHFEQAFKPMALYKDRIIPVIQANFLAMQGTEPYMEWGIGLDRVVLKWRIDVYASWRGGSYESFGLRFGVVN
jgi:hypothetical protein